MLRTARFKRAQAGFSMVELLSSCPTPGRTNALRMSDLPRAVLVLNKAYEFMAIRQESEE